jgi:hypothetical protein
MMSGPANILQVEARRGPGSGTSFRDIRPSFIWGRPPTRSLFAPFMNELLGSHLVR